MCACDESDGFRSRQSLLVPLSSLPLGVAIKMAPTPPPPAHEVPMSLLDMAGTAVVVKLLSSSHISAMLSL